jgi:hypothetical protein
MSLDEAMSQAASLVSAAGERLARLVELGTAVGERRTIHAEIKERATEPVK